MTTTTYKTIWKYILPASHTCCIDMPLGAEVLTAREQNDNVCVWALVDPKATGFESKHFVVAGTGHRIDEAGLRYVGTAYIRRWTTHQEKDFDDDSGLVPADVMPMPADVMPNHPLPLGDLVFHVFEKLNNAGGQHG